MVLGVPVFPTVVMKLKKKKKNSHLQFMCWDVDLMA
jgi:hypothetical protein